MASWQMRAVALYVRATRKKRYATREAGSADTLEQARGDALAEALGAAITTTVSIVVTVPTAEPATPLGDVGSATAIGDLEPIARRLDSALAELPPDRHVLVRTQRPDR